MFVLCRETKIVPNFVSILVKPLIAAIVCSTAAYFAEMIFDFVFYQRVATVLAIITAMVVYVVVLLLIKGIKKEDILQMPKGNKIIMDAYDYGIQLPFDITGVTFAPTDKMKFELKKSLKNSSL